MGPRAKFVKNELTTVKCKEACPVFSLADRTCGKFAASNPTPMAEDRRLRK